MSGKAVVIGNKNKPIEIPFLSLGNEDPKLFGNAVTGVLVVVNALNKFLRVGGEHSSSRERLTEGLTSEISLAYAEGRSNIYYCTFKKESGFTLEDLPQEFSTSEDDGIFYFNQQKKMIETIASYKPDLKKVRVVGIISSKQLSDLKQSLEGLEITLELDSPFLVTTN